MNPREGLYKESKMEQEKTEGDSANKFERQIAQKVSIKNLISGQYFKEEGWNPNYILVNGVKISRVNLIGTVISKEESEKDISVVLDDGTGQISVRSFEDKKSLEELNIGDSVLIIGRPREYGEKYVLVEVVRKLADKKWIKVRKLELGGKIVPVKTETIVEETVEAEQDSIADNVIECVKKLDSGEGVDFETVLEQIPDSKNTVDALLKEGDIFEVKPGRLKVLE